jgi:hypothetical protein
VFTRVSHLSVSSLSHMHPIDGFQPICFKVYFITTFPSTTGCSQCSLFLQDYQSKPRMTFSSSPLTPNDSFN